MKRIKSSAVLGGVCAGIARHLAIDSLWVRLGFAGLAWFFGITLVLYVLLWLLMERE